MMVRNEHKLCVSVPEMAKMLGIGKNKAYELAGQDGFPAVRLDGRIIIPLDGLNRWLNEQAAQRGA